MSPESSKDAGASAASPENPKVLEKYQKAGQMANDALATAVSLAKPGASVLDVCRSADERLLQLASSLDQDAKTPRGISFPCCVSVNSTVCYFSPASPDGDLLLSHGDLVKIELGAHVDGFPALVATSLVVGASKASPATGPAADLVRAAQLIAQAALALFRAGKTSIEIAQALKQLPAELNCKFIEGMISHSVGKDRLASDKSVIFSPSDSQAKAIEICTLADYDVFVLDIALSAGDAKVKPSDKTRPTVYMRTEENHPLRLKTSREVLGEIRSKFGRMAFNIRQLDGANRARVALNECTQHRVTNAYEVLEEQKGVLTARLMLTVVLNPAAGTLQITDPRCAPDAIQSTCAPTSQRFLELLAAH